MIQVSEKADTELKRMSEKGAVSSVFRIVINGYG